MVGSSSSSGLGFCGSSAMVREMLDHGVRFIVCGQSAASQGVAKSELIPGVELALSAMTAHALLQQQRDDRTQGRRIAQRRRRSFIPWLEKCCSVNSYFPCLCIRSTMQRGGRASDPGACVGRAARGKRKAFM